jgi:hypothetical protein
MRTLRVLLCVAGVGVAGYGVSGVVTATADDLPYYVGFALAGVAGHDLLLAPLTWGVAALLAWRLPAGLRGPVSAGLFASLAVAVIALPFLLGYGKRPDTPSALPLDYRHGLLITVGGVWIAVLALTFARAVSRRSRSGGAPGRNHPVSGHDAGPAR